MSIYSRMQNNFAVKRRNLLLLSNAFIIKSIFILDSTNNVCCYCNTRGWIIVGYVARCLLSTSVEVRQFEVCVFHCRCQQCGHFVNQWKSSITTYRSFKVRYWPVFRLNYKKPSAGEIRVPN